MGRRTVTTKIVRERVDALLRRARQEVDEGLLPSAQVALAADGELVAFETFGDATNDTQYTIWSATKPIVASAVWLLIGERSIDTGKRVAEYIPEFGTNGKDVVTVEQVLLHTAGFPLAPFDRLEWDGRSKRLDRFAEWRLAWEPGTKYEYHGTSGHWVLAELIERASGKDFRAFIRERVCEPLGLPGIHVGYPIDEQRDIADVALVGERMGPEEYRAAGLPEPPAGIDVAAMFEAFNLPAVRAVGVPGGGGIMRAADLALFYQALMHNPAGIWDAAIVKDATSKVRNTFPDPTGTPANRALGVIIAGDDGRSHLRGFGRTVSPRAFGHDGAAGQLGWADPETGLSLAYVTNGMHRHLLRMMQRGVEIASLAGLCTTELGADAPQPELA